MKTQIAINTFISFGWTKAQACGIVANLVKESNLNAAAVGDGGKAYGIAQWHPDRQAKFHTFMGKSIKGSTLDEQLLFVHWELSHNEKNAGLKLAKCATPKAAGACISRYYERPADKEGEAKKRADYADELFSLYKK